MEATKAGGTIIMAGLGVLAIGLFREVRSGRLFRSDALARRLFGFFAMTFFLLLLARPAPRVAKGLAWLALAGTLLIDGPELLGGLRFGGDKEPTRDTNPGLGIGGFADAIRGEIPNVSAPTPTPTPTPMPGDIGLGGPDELTRPVPMPGDIGL